jgi:hypothetical protein
VKTVFVGSGGKPAGGLSPEYMQGIVSDISHCSFKVAKMQEAWILLPLPLAFQKEKGPFRIFWVESELGNRDLNSLVALDQTGSASVQVHVVCSYSVNDLGLVWVTTMGPLFTEATYDLFDVLPF